VNDVFGGDYADSYDSLYSTKDYASECDLIEQIFEIHGHGAIARVLDLGCGTGNHALELSRRGYDVVGVDRSTSMLARARQKRFHGRGTLAFRQGDTRSLDLGQTFDAALMMFAVLGYQVENRDVLSALQTARRHLRADALFIFDVWYGPAVLSQRPSLRFQATPTTDGQILRSAAGDLDVRHHVCTVAYHIWRLADRLVVAESSETHVMRYFFPMELEVLLECAGFTLVRLGAFPDVDRNPDVTTWNCLAVARAA